MQRLDSEGPVLDRLWHKSFQANIYICLWVPFRPLFLICHHRSLWSLSLYKRTVSVARHINLNASLDFIWWTGCLTSEISDKTFLFRHDNYLFNLTVISLDTLLHFLWAVFSFEDRFMFFFFFNKAEHNCCIAAQAGGAFKVYKEKNIAK